MLEMLLLSINYEVRVWIHLAAVQMLYCTYGINSISLWIYYSINIKFVGSSWTLHFIIIGHGKNEKIFIHVLLVQNSSTFTINTPCYLYRKSQSCSLHERTYTANKAGAEWWILSNKNDQHIHPIMSFPFTSQLNYLKHLNAYDTALTDRSVVNICTKA